MAIGFDSGDVYIYDTTLTQTLTINAHTAPLQRIKYSSSNGYAVTCSNDNTAKVWNVASGWSLVATFTGHTDIVYGLEFINDITMASSSQDGTVQVWRTTTGAYISHIDLTEGAQTIQLLPNGYLAVGLFFGNIKVYDVSTGTLQATLSSHSMRVIDMAVSDDGKSPMLASAGYDKIVIWDLSTNTVLYNFNGGNFLTFVFFFSNAYSIGLTTLRKYFDISKMSFQFHLRSNGHHLSQDDHHFSASQLGL